MADPSLILGNGNWAVKSDSLLGYALPQGKYVPREFTVTRATTATRVNAQGLVEVVPYNLFLNSVFSGSGAAPTNWPQALGTGTSVLTTSTLGSDSQALSQSATAQRPFVSQSFTLLANTTYSYSIYIENVSGGLTNLEVLIASSLPVGAVATYYVNGVLVSDAAVAVTGRLTILIVVSSTGGNVSFRCGIGTSGNATGTLLFSRPQLVEGTDPLTYLPTTTRLNIPRVDYSLGSAALLLEPQRTNLLTYSEQFNDTSWVNTATIVTSNSTTAPNGLLTADTLVATASNSSHFLGQNVSVTTGTTLVFSCYVKNNGGNFVQLVAGAVAFSINDPYQNFNLQTGTLANGNIPTSTITNVGNGWYRLTCTLTTTSTGVAQHFIAPILNSTTGRLNSFTGDGINGIYIWGAQLEAGSYPTSYIPTTSASVTRNLEDIVLTGSSNIIGQTEGVLFTEVTFGSTDNGSKWIAFLWLSGSSYIGIYTVSNGRFICEVVNGGLAQFNITSSVFALPNEKHKIALAYKENDFAFYIDGVQIALDNSGTVPACNQVKFNATTTATNLTQRYYGSLRVYKERLSNSELATLTTL